jgi:DNA-binding CsgD family transcriptional regulator
VDRVLLAVVNAAYELHAPVDDWLETVVGAARPALDRGLGILGVTFRVENGQLTLTSRMVATGQVPDGLTEMLERLSPTLPPEHVNASWANARSMDSASATFRREHPQLRFADWPVMDFVRSFGVNDQIAAKALDPTGQGCIFLANAAEATRVNDRDARRWGRVMAHVLAAARMREALETQAEAVIEPGGRLVHAEGVARHRSAREALRNAAIQIDQAKSRNGKSDPATALSRWRALVSGRWSLVDSFESDGRRYLLARRNDPRLGLPRALSERERQIVGYAVLGHSNKYIAYALGLAPSTVSTHLAAAMRGLGARTPAELVRIWTQETSASTAHSER